MGIRDSFRRSLEALNAAITKRDADRQGQAKNGLSTGAGHNPITGTPSVRQPDGGIVGTTTPITSGSLGQGNPVQVTGNGLRTVVDAAQAKAGEDLASASSIAGRGGNPGGGGSNSFIPPGGGPPASPIPGWNPDTQDGGWVPGEDGTCSFKIWPKGKKPKTGVYETGDECLQENAPGDWVCQDGQCVEAAEGQGRWKFKRECEEALGPLPFEGGQCRILYEVRLRGSYSFTYLYQGTTPVTNTTPFTNISSAGASNRATGPISSVGWEDGQNPGQKILALRGEIYDNPLVLMQLTPIWDGFYHDLSVDIELRPWPPGTEEPEECRGKNPPRQCPS